MKGLLTSLSQKSVDKSLVLVMYAHKLPLNAYADKSIGAGGLNFSMSLQLHPFFVYSLSSVGSGKFVICTEPLLLDNTISTKISYAGLHYSKTCLKRPLKNRPNKGLKDKW